jgi:predicted nucleic acid-binding Zn ribbon protein
MALSGLSHILHNIQSRTSWQQRCQYLLVVEHWAAIVGESVAQQSSPIGIHQNVLQVAVSNSIWSQALTFERLRILTKINDMMAKLSPQRNSQDAIKIVDIHFSTAKWATRQQTLSLAKLSNTEHPSYLPEIKNSSASPTPLQPLPPPENAREAFERWQKIMKLRSPQMPRCPQCDRPTMKGELTRWQMCRVCAIEKLFQNKPI